MATLKITKAELIREIMMAVNAKAVMDSRCRKADGDMFFQLAFMSEKELKGVCKKAGIAIW